MTEQNDRLAREREEIASRVASFKATQEKFEREREEYFVTTLENARNGSDGSRSGHKIEFRRVSRKKARLHRRAFLFRGDRQMRALADQRFFFFLPKIAFQLSL